MLHSGSLIFCEWLRTKFNKRKILDKISPNPTVLSKPCGSIWGGSSFMNSQSRDHTNFVLSGKNIETPKVVEENPFLIITVRAFLAFFSAKTTKPVLLSDNLQASFVFAAKLWSNEEELHERVDAVDAIPTLSFTLTHSLLGFMRFMILSLCYASVVLQRSTILCFTILTSLQNANYKCYPPNNFWITKIHPFLLSLFIFPFFSGK